MRRFTASNVLACLAALGILPVLATVLRRAVEIPYWDEWEWTDLVYAAHTNTLTFAQIWAAHNEHRIVIPNLIMLGLDRLGGWAVVREQIVSLIILALTQLFVWLLIARTVRESRRGLCFVVVTALLFGFAQFENLDWGFQLAWFLCDLGLVVAVWALTRPRRNSGDVLIAAAAATIASLSSSQGLVVWAAGLVAIVMVSRRVAPTAIAWLAVGGIVTAIVRSGSPGAGAVGHVGLTHVVLLTQYCLAYIGSPLVGSFGVDAATLAGLGFVGWSLGLAAIAIRSPLRERVRLAPWIAMATYPIVCAIVTAPARAGFGLFQADASRYTSITSLGWIALVAATFAVVPRGRLALSLAVVPSAFVLWASSVQTFVGNELWHDHTVTLRAARADLAAGDPAGLPLVYPDRARVLRLLSELARIRDGLFSDS